MGGDCLNTGCVPSKAILAAAKMAHSMSTAGDFGISCSGVSIDFPAVRRHVDGVIAAIAPHDSEERFTKLGCRVVRAAGRFVSSREVQAGDILIQARRFVVATGSRPALPPIPGLDAIPYLTNETIFDLETLPRHLIIIGAGPIGCEMAQAFRRLGSQVTVVEKASLLPKDDTEAAGIVRQALIADGISLMEETDIASVSKAGDTVAMTLSEGRQLTGSHLLVAAGRKPNIEDLNLAAAGIEYSRHGIIVDSRLRTSNRHVFAAGDVAGGPQFTHWAGYQAGIVLRNALFRIPASADITALPWVTYTDPQLAQVGLTEAAARERHGDSIRILRADFIENDRAQAECKTTGFAKAIVGKRGRILGATIVGAEADNLIQHWGLAMTSKLRIGALAASLPPYPTLGEINKRAAGNYFTPTIFGPRVRLLVRLLGLLG